MQAVELVKKTKGIAKTLELAAKHAQLAEDAIARFPPCNDMRSQQCRRALSELAQSVLKRSKWSQAGVNKFWQSYNLHSTDEGLDSMMPEKEACALSLCRLLQSNLLFHNVGHGIRRLSCALSWEKSCWKYGGLFYLFIFTQSTATPCDHQNHYTDTILTLYWLWQISVFIEAYG